LGEQELTEKQRGLRSGERGFVEHALLLDELPEMRRRMEKGKGM